MKTVDAKGRLCPLPLIMTKKALLEMKSDESLLVLVDNETSMKNVRHFLEDHGMEVNLRQSGNVFEMSVGKTMEISEEVDAGEYCTTDSAPQASYVVAVERDHLGDGDPELGKMLMKAFINTLPDTSLLPSAIVFLNSGIFLSLKDSPVLEALKKLEATGTEILVCGTCLDYYEKKNNLSVGKVSNMYDILERLTKAAKVLYP